MKYEIKHSCGCEETVQLFGKASERERRIAWLESKPCRECERKARAARAEEQGLPALAGTEKQVAWAVDIRERMLAEFAEFTRSNIESAEARGAVTAEQAALAKANTERARKAIEQVPDAKWFIDHRDEPMRSLYRTACGLAAKDER